MENETTARITVNFYETGANVQIEGKKLDIIKSYQLLSGAMVEVMKDTAKTNDEIAESLLIDVVKIGIKEFQNTDKERVMSYE